MQRFEGEGIIISCDFCGTDWDPYDQSYSRPMTEGHQGSVICLPCVIEALEHLRPSEKGFKCCMCLVEKEAKTPCWQYEEREGEDAIPVGRNPQALACDDCIKQAAGVFSKDEDIDWRWDRRGK